MLVLKKEEVGLLRRQVEAAEAAGKAGWTRADKLSLLALLVSVFALAFAARKQIRAWCKPKAAERARLEKAKAEEKAKRQAAKELDEEEAEEERRRQPRRRRQSPDPRESPGPRRSSRVSRPPVR